MGMIQAPNQAPADRLDQMVQQYEKDLLRICCIYLRDRTAAEDVVQETFLKAFRNLDSFRGESSEKTWLIKIAMNSCRDYRRSAWHRYIDRRVSIDQLPILSSAPPSDDHIALTRPARLCLTIEIFPFGFSTRASSQMTYCLSSMYSSTLWQMMKSNELSSNFARAETSPIICVYS